MLMLKRINRTRNSFCDIDTAIREYPEIVKKYLGTIVSVGDNKFSALNSCVFSGGSFAFVPKGVKTPMPLQAYFKVTAASSGQYERTLLIADEGAELEYSEGCSSVQDKGTNFHTAVVELIAHKNAKIFYTTIQNWKKICTTGPSNVGYVMKEVISLGQT